jgi:hypothetical protein
MRIPHRLLSLSIAVAAAILLLPTARPAFALQKPAPIAAPAAPPSDDELATTREQLLALLRMSPTLTQVVEVDPSLLADQEYVSRANPQLAQFLTQHPEVARNPDFYLFGDFSTRNGRYVESLRRRGNDDESKSDRIRREYLSDVMDSLTFIGIGGALLWLIRLFLQSRRWSRLFRLQSEVHNKLIDRFANNQEVLHYMETEPGRRFLEAAPIPIEFEQNQRTPGGLSRILGPLQLGIVLTLLGAGLLILQRSLPDIAAPLLIFGMVTLMPGLGFIISALITWRMSVRLGLLPQGPQSSTELADRQ